MIEEWRVRDLEARLDRVENEREVTLHLLSAFMWMFLETSPETTRRARFKMICEEAEARCRSDEQKSALRSIVSWEGEDTGWVKRSVI